MAKILEVVELTKDFRDKWNWRRFRVLDRVSLQIEEGEIFGLIGPNGAGKTTTFKLLLGLLRPSHGTIRFEGRPMGTAARVAIGFLPEQSYFYDYLTVSETLDLYARLHGLSAVDRKRRIADVIEQLQLGAKRKAALRTLSKGTLQRVGVAQAIVNRPRLLILDEPMSGLDPAGRHLLRELILALRDAGTTVIFSSHILPDAEALCSRVGILVHGRLQEVVQLLRGEDEYAMTVSGLDASELATLQQIGTYVSSKDGRCTIRLHGQATVRAALEVIQRGDGSVQSLNRIQPSLEERFLAHVGHTANLD